MSVAYRNLTLKPVHLALNSGSYVRLSPGMVSAGLHEVEVRNNAKIDKLLAMRAIAVEPQAAPKGKAGKPEEAEHDAAETRPKKGGR